MPEEKLYTKTHRQYRTMSDVVFVSRVIRYDAMIRTGQIGARLLGEECLASKQQNDI